jgi:hypothetical protein
MLDLKPFLGVQEISQTKKTLRAFSQCQLKTYKINQGIWTCKGNVVIQTIELYRVHLKAHKTSLQQGKVLISFRKKVSLGLVLDKLDNFKFQAITKCSSSAQDQHTYGVLSWLQLKPSIMKYEV